ncbi:MAG: hypothetical protein CM15mP46_3180 [Alphaproteobacteria bacterium]|nr:MAG: hypothetical protein CM15mP46_3180 [Alphaproteobacteria bacterium]
MQDQARGSSSLVGRCQGYLLYHLSKLGCSDAIMLERLELTRLVQHGMPPVACTPSMAIPMLANSSNTPSNYTQRSDSYPGKISVCI